MTVTITSPRNAAVRDARRLAERPERDADGRLLVEGPQAVEAAGRALERLFATAAASRRHAGVVNGARRDGVDVVEVDDAVLRLLADTRAPQGLVGVARLAEPSLAAVLATARRVVVLVAAQDPGNVGTAIRTAEVSGCDAVVLTDGTVNVRNPKVVRASAGAVFHLPVVRAPVTTLTAGARRAGLRSIATTPRAARPHYAVDLREPVALLFGNEAHGLPEEVVEACDDRLGVPILGRGESLNLAATVAVVCYEAARQAGSHAGSEGGAP